MLARKQNFVNRILFGSHDRNINFDNFDFIYPMDESNYRNIIALARNTADKAKVKMILNEVYPNENASVPDPYYGGKQGFENVYKMLDEACEIIAEKLS